MNKRSAAMGFLRFAGRFYKWAFGSMFRLVKKSDENIRAIEEKKRAAAIQRNLSNPSQP
jgi:hypothetical protein